MILAAIIILFNCGFVFSKGIFFLKIFFLIIGII